MNPKVGSDLIAKYAQSGWPSFLFVVALMAAIVFATPLAFAVDPVEVNPEITDSNPLVPGSAHGLTAGVTVNDQSIILGYQWEQVFEEDAEGNPAGVAVSLDDATIENPTVTLTGTETEYAAYLIKVLVEPPISEADLPPVKLQPYNEIEKGLQTDRPQLVAINPFALERAGEFHLRVTVTTTTGQYSGDVTAVAELPWVVNPGVRTVPVNVPVLLFAPDAPEGSPPYNYDWTVVASPNGSGVTVLTDADQQSAWFTPDRTGRYDFMENALSLIHI